MPSFFQALYGMHHLDELSRKDTLIHRLHPLSKVLTTLAYLIVVASYGRYAVDSLLILIFYPVVLIALGEIPLAPILRRVLLVEPFIIGIAVINPFLDQLPVVIGGFALARGWLTFLSILIKGGLSVTSGLLLIVTAGMDQIAVALRMLRVPRLFVLQLLLTYRYISVLTEEAGRIWNGYTLRAPRQKGISVKAWGPLVGQMLIRSIDKAQRVHEAMGLRGFQGDYPYGADRTMKVRDWLYTICWIIFFVICRFYNLTALLGTVITGGGL